MSALGWRMTRAGQMATQYYWLYERTSPLTWRPAHEVDRFRNIMPGDAAPHHPVTSAENRTK